MDSEITSKESEQLKSQLKGVLTKPGEPEFEQSNNLWNGYFDPQPRAIALCKNVGDVQATLNFAREKNLKFSVKSGGHDYSGNSVLNGGLVIDLSQMNYVSINPDKKTAIAGPGVRWGEFDEAAQKYGLATTGATVSHVGVAGYTLGGGTGYLSRKYGLALDNLISAELVKADGKIIKTDKENHPDLFWAIRGGGGNFGIVTSFEFQLQKVSPQIMAGQIVHPIEKAADTLRFYRKFMEKSSDEMACYAFFLNIPPLDAFPEEYHGKSAISLVLAHTGDEETAKNELQLILDFGEPILSAVQPMPYTAAQKMFDEGMPKGNRWYSKAHMLDSLSNDAIDTILQYTKKIPGPFSVAYLEPLGGAINRVKTNETAFPHRNSDYSFHIFAGWSTPDNDTEPIKWAKEFYQAMTPHTNGGVYVNLLGHDDEDRISQAYSSNHNKLIEIKKKWDPENLFRSNHNIVPA